MFGMHDGDVYKNRLDLRRPYGQLIENYDLDKLRKHNGIDNNADEIFKNDITPLCKYNRDLVDVHIEQDKISPAFWYCKMKKEKITVDAYKLYSHVGNYNDFTRDTEKHLLLLKTLNSILGEFVSDDQYSDTQVVIGFIETQGNNIQNCMRDLVSLYIRNISNVKNTENTVEFEKTFDDVGSFEDILTGEPHKDAIREETDKLFDIYSDITFGNHHRKMKKGIKAILSTVMCTNSAYVNTMNIYKNIAFLFYSTYELHNKEDISLEMLQLVSVHNISRYLDTYNISFEDYEIYSNEDFVERVKNLGVEIIKKIEHTKAKVITKINFKSNSRKNKKFKKFLGITEEAYKRQGSSIKIMENKPKNDVVDTLYDNIPEYLRKLIENFIDISNDMIRFYRNLDKCRTKEEILKLANKYISHKEFEVNNIKELQSKILQDAYYKFGNILNQNNTVYGRNAIDIGLRKKLPSPNHTMVSLFVDNPERKPAPIPVNDIFEKYDSFEKLIYKADDYEKDLNQIIDKLRKVNIYTDVAKSLIADLQNNPGESDEVDKLKQNLGNLADKNFVIFNGFSVYIIKLFNIIPALSTRVYDLTGTAMSALMEWEQSQRDSDYKTGAIKYKDNRTKSHKQAK